MTFNIQSSNNPNQQDIPKYMSEYYDTKIKDLVEEIQQQCISNSNDISQLQINLQQLSNLTDSMITTLTNRVMNDETQIDGNTQAINNHTADITELQNKTEYNVSEINPEWITFGDYASFNGSGIAITPDSIWINGCWIINNNDTENYVSKYIAIGDVTISHSVERTDLLGSGLHIDSLHMNELHLGNTLTTPNANIQEALNVDGTLNVVGDTTLKDVTADNITSTNIEATTNKSKSYTYNGKVNIESIPAGYYLWLNIGDFDGVYSVKMPNGSSFALTKHGDYREIDYNKAVETDIVGVAAKNDNTYLKLLVSGEYEIGYTGFGDMPTISSATYAQGDAPEADWYRELRKDHCKYILAPTDSDTWGEYGVYIGGTISADGMEMPPITDIVVTDRLTVDGLAEINRAKINEAEIEEATIGTIKKLGEIDTTTITPNASYLKITGNGSSETMIDLDDDHLIVSYTDDNFTVKYSNKNETLEDKLYVLDNELYIKLLLRPTTIKTISIGSDSVVEITDNTPPITARDFDLTEAEGTIFTKYVNVGIGDLADITFNPVAFDEADTEEKIYDGIDPVEHNYYAPNQDLDNTAEPSFPAINITTGTSTDTVVRADSTGRVYRQEPATIDNGKLIAEGKLVEDSTFNEYNGTVAGLEPVSTTGEFYNIALPNVPAPNIAVVGTEQRNYTAYILKTTGNGEYYNSVISQDDSLPELSFTYEMPESIAYNFDWSGYTVAASEQYTYYNDMYEAGDTVLFNVFNNNTTITHEGSTNSYAYLSLYKPMGDAYQKYNNGTTSFNEYYARKNNYFTDFTNPNDISEIKTYLNADVGLVHNYMVTNNYGNTWRLYDHFPTVSEFAPTVSLQYKDYSSAADLIADIHNAVSITYDGTVDFNIADWQSNRTFIACTLYRTTYGRNGIPVSNTAQKNAGMVNALSSAYKYIVGTITVQKMVTSLQMESDILVPYSNKQPDSTLSNEASPNPSFLYWNGYILKLLGSGDASNPNFPAYFETTSKERAFYTIENPRPYPITLVFDSNGDLSSSDMDSSVTTPTNFAGFLSDSVYSPLYRTETHIGIDPAVSAYPITNLGDGTTVHGDLSVEGDTTLGTDGNDTITLNGTTQINADTQIGDETHANDLKVGGDIYKYDALNDNWVSIDDTYIPQSEKDQPYGVPSLDDNGLVPTTELPKATLGSVGVIKPGDGLSIDNNGEVEVVDRLVEVSTMPSPTVDYEGQMRLYTGATTVDYKNGGIYQCREITPATDPATYEWVLVSSANLSAGTGIDITNDTVSVINRVPQYTTIPSSMSVLENLTIQYVGQDTANYKHNYFYEYKTVEGVAGWYPVDVQKHNIASVRQLGEIKPDQYFLTVDEYGNASVDKKLTSLPVLPNMDLTNVGEETVLLTDDFEDYKKGGIYQSNAELVEPVGTENPNEEGWYEYNAINHVYEPSYDETVVSGKSYYELDWKLISSSNLQAGEGIEIEDDTISVQPSYKKIFTGTHAEWEELTLAEKTAYDEADFVDDVASGFPVISDVVADGDMNPVTSNAVAKAIEPVNERPTIIKATMVNQTIGNDVRCYPKSFKIQLYLGGTVDSNGKLCSFTLPEGMTFRVGGWGTSFMGIARNTGSGEVVSVVMRMDIDANNVVTIFAEGIPSGYTEIRVLNVTLLSLRLS